MEEGRAWVQWKENVLGRVQDGGNLLQFDTCSECSVGNYVLLVLTLPPSLLELT